MSDGHEARFSIKEPAKEISSEISIVETRPLLSSRPPVYPPDEMVDGGDNPLLLASWQDPERSSNRCSYTCQAALTIIWLGLRMIE